MMNCKIPRNKRRLITVNNMKYEWCTSINKGWITGIRGKEPANMLSVYIRNLDNGSEIRWQKHLKENSGLSYIEVLCLPRNDPYHDKWKKVSITPKDIESIIKGSL